MPQLSRRSCGRLLHRVKDQSHATSDDHVADSAAAAAAAAAERSPRRSGRKAFALPTPDVRPSSGGGGAKREERKLRAPRAQEEQQPTPPSSDRLREAGERRGGGEKAAVAEEEEGDVMRDPLSSSDEKGSVSSASSRASGKRKREHRFQRPRSFDGPSTGAVDGADDGPDSDREPAWLTSSQQSKRVKLGGFANFHAAPRTFAAGRLKAPTTYSKKAPPVAAREKKKGLKLPKQREGSPVEQNPGRKFVQARNWSEKAGDDELHEGGLHQSESDSPLSSVPSSPREVELLAEAYITDATSIACALCGATVDILVKQNFEDEFTRGRAMNFRWQQRFCRHHKQHDARELWAARGYPEIDWHRLEKRLPRHRSHLLAVLTGQTASPYRDDLRERVKSGKKTMLQSLDSSAHKRSAAGYYGPRGEKAMTDHILTHLADEIRQQAARDPLVAASGVAGGVSGFVQSVLVPELAARLVMEDLDVGHARAATVLRESAEVGELLFPELEDRVVREEALVEG